MAILTKYVSVTTGNDATGDGSAGSPYKSIETARADIQSTLSGDAGPHYVILSESSGASTIYSASYGMPLFNYDSGNGFEQELWLGSYDYGIIVSASEGQDITVTPGTPNATGSWKAALFQKSAFELFGSGSGIHNITIAGCGAASATDGAIKGNGRPYDIRTVTINASASLAGSPRQAPAGGGITGLGDTGGTNAWTIVDSCRILLTGSNNFRGIDFSHNPQNALINNCLIILSGTTGDMPINAINASNGTLGTSNRCTASFCTVLVRHDGATYTGQLGIYAARVENCIVSMSIPPPGDGLNFPYIQADVATNNFYGGLDGSSTLLGNGVYRNFAGTSQSLGATDLVYTTASVISLFEDPSDNFTNLYADYTLASTAVVTGAGTAVNYLGLTSADLSGTSRQDPPDLGCFELATSSPSKWCAYGSQTYPEFSADFTINSYLNLSSNYKLACTGAAAQVPFFLGVHGPPSLRKNQAYLATTSDPSQITGSS